MDFLLCTNQPTTQIERTNFYFIVGECRQEVIYFITLNFFFVLRGLKNKIIFKCLQHEEAFQVRVFEFLSIFQQLGEFAQEIKYFEERENLVLVPQNLVHFTILHGGFQRKRTAQLFNGTFFLATYTGKVDSQISQTKVL